MDRTGHGYQPRKPTLPRNKFESNCEEQQQDSFSNRRSAYGRPLMYVGNELIYGPCVLIQILISRVILERVILVDHLLKELSPQIDGRR
jgi:hypothetical protein